MTTFVFPGQGSQAKGMGANLFAEFPQVVQEANEILGYDVAALCLEDNNNQLNQTNFTQPALFTVNALSFLQKQKQSSPLPKYVAGHSLGEYNALFAANVFDFATGLKLVKKRGELMSQATGGGMAAIVGLTATAVQKILDENSLSELTIANYNANTQVVISGPKEKVFAAEHFFLNGGASFFIPLKVSGAFHSPFMNAAQQEFAEFLRAFEFNSPSIPVIANVTAKPYQANDICETLAKQINHPVLWTQSIQHLLANQEKEFVEVGPGKVLTGLIARIQRE